MSTFQRGKLTVWQNSPPWPVRAPATCLRSQLSAPIDWTLCAPCGAAASRSACAGRSHLHMQRIRITCRLLRRSHAFARPARSTVEALLLARTPTFDVDLACVDSNHLFNRPSGISPQSLKLRGKSAVPRRPFLSKASDFYRISTTSPCRSYVLFRSFSSR